MLVSYILLFVATKTQPVTKRNRCISRKQEGICRNLLKKCNPNLTIVFIYLIFEYYILRENCCKKTYNFFFSPDSISMMLVRSNNTKSPSLCMLSLESRKNTKSPSPFRTVPPTLMHMCI